MKVTRKIIASSMLVMLMLTSSTYGDDCPKKAKKYIPIIVDECKRYWPTICPIEIIPAQIQKESNWNVYAERKAGKEYGFGLSQTTIVKGRFNNFLQFKKRWKKELEQWKWNNRFAPKFHIRVMVLYDKMLWDKVGFAKTIWDRWAFTLSAYNGGLGWVYKDRKLAKLKGYNPDMWFDNVEKVSWRSKWSYKVNRTYVRKIMLVYAPKYKPCFKQTWNTIH